MYTIGALPNRFFYLRDTRVVELERLLQGERDEKSSDKRTLGEVTQQLEEFRSAKLQLENDLAQLKNDLARAREDLGAVTKGKGTQVEGCEL